MENRIFRGLNIYLHKIFFICKIFKNNIRSIALFIIYNEKNS